MIRIKHEELLSMINDILIAFKKYCDANDLKFYLAYGTLLGAIRHKGFIPWDDDIDVQMESEQIEKMINLLKKTDNYIDDKKRYLVLLPFDDRNIYPFIKIIDTETIVYEKNISKKFATGLWIDVFEIQNVPRSINECKKINKKHRFYTNMNKILVAGNFKDLKFKILNIFASPIRILFNLVGLDTKYWISKFMKLKINENTGYKGGVIWTDCVKNRMKSDFFDEDTLVVFEENTYYAPKDYDLYLSTLFGNYMVLPPESDRRRHDFEAYIIVNQERNSI